MVKVKRFGFGTTGANCYVVSDDTRECIVIDPCAQAAMSGNSLPTTSQMKN